MPVIGFILEVILGVGLLIAFFKLMTPLFAEKDPFHYNEFPKAIQSRGSLLEFIFSELSGTDDAKLIRTADGLDIMCYINSTILIVSIPKYSFKQITQWPIPPEYLELIESLKSEAIAKGHEVYDSANQSYLISINRKEGVPWNSLSYV